MKKILVISLILILSSCTDNQNPSLKKLKVYTNAQVVDTYPFVGDGNNHVFHYFHKKEDEENIADDEFAEDFLLEIPIDSEFTLTAQELQEVNHIYQQYCFCGQTNYSKIISGSLEGQIITSDNWRLEGSITLEVGYLNETTKEIDWSFEKVLSLSGTYGSFKIPSE